MNNVCWSPFSFFGVCDRAKLWPLVSRSSCDVPEPCLPSASVCGMVTVIWPHSCDSQHHEQSQPLPEVTGTCWRTFWLQQSTVCACCIPHGCAAERSSSTTHFSIRAVRSPDLLVFPIGNEALPQTVSPLKKAVTVFPSWSDVLLMMEVAVRHCVTGAGLCVSVCFGRAWFFVWLSPVA